MLSPLYELRIVALTLGGSAFSGAVLTTVPITTLHMLRTGDVRSVADVAPELAFFVLASLLLFVVGRAWLRVRRGDESADPFLTGLAKVTPFAVALGLVGGGAFAFSVNASHDANVRVLAQLTCRDALGWSASEVEIAACEPQGVTCNHLENERRKRDHLGTSAFTGADRPEAVCARERLVEPAP